MSALLTVSGAEKRFALGGGRIVHALNGVDLPRVYIVP